MCSWSDNCRNMLKCTIPCRVGSHMRMLSCSLTRPCMTHGYFLGMEFGHLADYGYIYRRRGLSHVSREHNFGILSLSQNYIPFNPQANSYRTASLGGYQYFHYLSNLSSHQVEALSAIRFPDLQLTPSRSLRSLSNSNKDPYWNFLLYKLESTRNGPFRLRDIA